jgi:hypothetical protein
MKVVNPDFTNYVFILFINKKYEYLSMKRIMKSIYVVNILIIWMIESY